MVENRYFPVWGFKVRFVKTSNVRFDSLFWRQEKNPRKKGKINLNFENGKHQTIIIIVVEKYMDQGSGEFFFENQM